MTYIFNDPGFSQERANFSYQDYKFGLADTFIAMADETLMHNPSVALSRLLEDRFFSDDEPRLSVDEANEKYSIGNLKFEEPVTETRAKKLYERQKASMERSEILSKGPDGISGGAFKFGTSLLFSAIDPINIAASFLPSTAVLAGARALKVAAPAWALGEGTIATRALYGAAEGAAGAAIIEPLPYFAAQRDDLDYGLMDSFLNITIGTVLGGGLHALAKGLEIRGEDIKNRKISELSETISRLPEEQRRQILGDALVSALDDKLPDLGAKVAATLPENILDTRGRGEYFHGAPKELQTAVVQSGNYGPGFYTTDALDIAADYKKQGGESGTSVYKITEKEPVNVYDADAPIEQPLLDKIKVSAGSDESGILNKAIDRLVDYDTPSLKNLLDEVREEGSLSGLSDSDLSIKIESIQNAIKEQGYGAMKYLEAVNTKTPHETKVYFDPENQLNLSQMDNGRATPPLPARDLFVDPPESPDIDTKMAADDAVALEQDVQKQSQILDEMLAPLDEQSRQEYKLLLEEADIAISEAKEMNDAVRQLGFCVIRN